MEKKVSFKTSEIQEMTGQGPEFLVDKNGVILAKFNDGSIVDPLPKTNSEITKTGA